MKTTTSTAARAEASRYAAAGPLLERTEAIETRLHAIKAEERAVEPGKFLPEAEVVERIRTEIRGVRERFATPAPGVFNISTLLSDLSSERPMIRVGGGLAPTEHLFGLMVWLLGSDLEARAGEAVKALHLPASMPSADRVKVRAKLTAERTRLESEHEAAVESLSELGVERAHLPVVVQRRAQAARQAELDEQRRKQADEVAAAMEARGPRLAPRIGLPGDRNRQ